jgi:hypothetical protein
MKVQNNFNFDGLELFIGIREFLEYPANISPAISCLAITQFYVLNEVWIEKSTNIYLYIFSTVTQGFHDYVIIPIHSCLL